MNLGYTARPCLKNKTIYSPFYPFINKSIHQFCLLPCTQFINQLFYKPLIINPPHPSANSSIIHPLIYQLKCIYPFINLEHIYPFSIYFLIHPSTCLSIINLSWVHSFCWVVLGTKTPKIWLEFTCQPWEPAPRDGLYGYLSSNRSGSDNRNTQRRAKERAGA